MQNNIQDQYRQADVVTADKCKLVVLLYEGAINFLQKAKDSVVEGNIVEKSNYINRAQDIIQELQFSLRVDVGGEIAQNLNELYQFMLMHLVKSKISNNGVEKIDDVIHMLRIINEAWRDIQSTPDAAQMRLAEQAEKAEVYRGLSV